MNATTRQVAMWSLETRWAAAMGASNWAFRGHFATEAEAKAAADRLTAHIYGDERHIADHVRITPHFSN